MRSLHWLAPLLVLACDDTDNKGWLVDRTRVLGARVEAASEPSRAAIVPGEAMRLTWLVGAPNGTGNLSYAYAFCAPVDGNFPEPKCEGPVFGSGTGTSDGEVVPMDIVTPASVGDLDALQFLVAFCESGAAHLDAARFEASCDGGSPARLATANVRLARSGPNTNPEIASDAVALDGVPLTPSTVRSGPCTGDATSPVVVAGSKHAIGYHFRGDERENVPSEGLEKLIASHVVTAGELDHQYSMLDPSEPAPKDVSIDWTAPASDRVGEGGRLVEIYVVVRDGRGGEAFARRTVCVRETR